jgi:Mrp family chromosome partitioning ATPase
VAEAPADIERRLDRLVTRLRGGSTKEAKALLVDARRLLTVVRNWQTIAPTDDALTEMVARVEQLARSVEVLALPEASPQPSPAPERPAQRSPVPAERPAAVERPVQRSPAVERPVQRPPAAERPAQRPPAAERPVERAAPRSPLPAERPGGEETTRAAPIDARARADEERAVARSVDVSATPGPVRARTLPDLDISNIAQLVDDGPGVLDDHLASDWAPAGRGRGAPDGLPRRPGSDPVRGRPASEPPPRARPPSHPPNGRHRGDADIPALDDRSGSDRPTRANRPSRFLSDPESDTDGAGPVYPVGSDEPQPAPRNTMTARASAPPPRARGDKSLIAVHPLPPPEVIDPRLVLLTDPFSPRADAYRALRRKLTGPSAPKTIAVTSAKPEEGKTSCAANLALALRETSNERILLVEANLKAPGLAKLFGFEPPVCFAKQMAKNRDSTRASWTVVEQFEPLHVLAVDPSSKTSPMLDPVAFANAMEQLVEAGYDHIIVDTPPALGGSDVNIIADAVDGIVVVAWIRKSKKSLVKQAVDQLKPATILGVVTLEG